MAKKKAKKSGKKRKPNAAFMKPMNPSATLAAVIGSGSMPRTEVTKKIWGYIKRNGLQDKKNRRNINADDKLKAVFAQVMHTPAIEAQLKNDGLSPYLGKIEDFPAQLARESRQLGAEMKALGVTPQ